MKPHELAEEVKQIIAEVCRCKGTWGALDGSGLERGPVTREEANLILQATVKLFVSITPIPPPTRPIGTPREDIL